MNSDIIKEAIIINLKQLQEVVNHSVKYAEEFCDPAEIEVVIPVADPVKEDKPKEKIGIMDGEFGLNMNAGTFRLEPEFLLVRNGHAYTDDMPVIEYREKDGKILRKCRRCERRIDSDKDKYCWNCGQKLLIR